VLVQGGRGRAGQAPEQPTELLRTTSLRAFLAGTSEHGNDQDLFVG